MCQERKELERLIFNCVRTISYLSMSTSGLARSPGLSRPSDFDVLHREYETASVRLKVLCECLEIHIKHHGCAASIPHLGAVVRQSFESWDRLQRRVPGAIPRVAGRVSEVFAYWKAESLGRSDGSGGGTVRTAAAAND